jgi:hypothetical protein
MSRTKRGSKPPGWEFWSRRPQSGGVGAESKRICHSQERMQKKELLQDELAELEETK